MTLIIFEFITGLTVMLISAKVFLDITQEFSVKWRFSPLFIALVVVALGTNLPELVVTISALQHLDPGLAMGNAVGSSITNLTIVLGLSTFFKNIRVGTTKTPKNALILLITTFLFSVLSLSSILSYYQVAILSITLIMVLSYQYILAKRGRFHEDKKLLAIIEKLHNKRKQLPKIAYLLLFLGSIIGLGIGGNITVTSVESISLTIGISTTILGLTLTSIATSLPELLMSLMSNNKNNKVALGTLMGSNIFNLTLFPTIILYNSSNYEIKKLISITEIFFLILITTIFYGIIKKYKGKTIPKEISIILITYFIMFILFIFA